MDPFCQFVVHVHSSIVLKLAQNVEIKVEIRVIFYHVHELDCMDNIICHLLSFDTEDFRVAKTVSTLKFG